MELVPVFTTPEPRKLKTIEVNALTTAGVETVVQLYERDADREDVRAHSSGHVQPLPETIAHDLAIRDALIFLTRLLDGSGIPIHWFTFRTRELVQQGMTRMRHAPDLIMVVGERRVPLLIEVDLGTESIASTAPNSWATKYQQYVSYLQKDFGNDPLFDGCAKPLMIVLSQ